MGVAIGVMIGLFIAALFDWYDNKNYEINYCNHCGVMTKTPRGMKCTYDHTCILGGQKTEVRSGIYKFPE